MARKKKEAPPENTERWLTTYSDLISLLMIFFVVMFASSEVAKEKLLAISESLRRALNKDAVMASTVGTAILSSPAREITTSVSEAIKETARAFGLDKGVTFSTDERGILITMADSLFFDPGSYKIKERSKLLLKEVAAFCKEAMAKVMIEGHTDNIEVPDDKKFELSALRAIEVTKFIIKSVDFPIDMIGASGFGDTRPLLPNINPQNRARNRRVDILLVNVELKKKTAKSHYITQMDVIERERSLKEESIIESKENK